MDVTAEEGYILSCKTTVLVRSPLLIKKKKISTKSYLVTLKIRHLTPNEIYGNEIKTKS